eukprot:gene41232-50319_t
MEGLTRSLIPISDEEVENVAEVTARAFFNTKSYNEIFRGTPETRVPQLAQLFSRNIGMIRQKEPGAIHCYYSDSSKSEVACSFVLIRSTVTFTLWEKVWAGLLTLVVLFGFQTFGRMMQASDWFDERIRLISEGREYFELQRMIVNPAYQGKGIGSRLLGEALKEADDAKLPVILSTQDDRNVVFYSRLGFKVMKEEIYSPSDNSEEYSYKCTFMLREPRL